MSDPRHAAGPPWHRGRRGVHRRPLLAGTAAWAAGLSVTGCVTADGAGAAPDDRWGATQGYPTGWGPPGQPPRWEAYPAYRAGNYAGGFETMFRTNRVAAGPAPSPMGTAGSDARLTAAARDHVRAWPVTGLLIARDGRILFEQYGHGRGPEMRLTSWSMAKSVTSLLFGIALDRGLLRSVDDTAADYAPSLAGTLHGGIRLRHLLNMSSGAEVDHARDAARIDVPGLLGRPDARAAGTDLERVVRGWNAVREPPGTRFNYTELCPLTIGMVLRAVTGGSLADFASATLWRPMGAEADATWLADAQGHEYNCVGFAARLRDWARLGRLVAQQGRVDGRQVVGADWIEACRTWGPQDRQVAHGAARPGTGYRNFFWHPRADGRWMVMEGHHGQRVAVDTASRTVMVQTALDAEGPWSRSFYAVFERAIEV